MKLLVCSDLHLTNYPLAKLPQLTNDSFFALEDIINKAISNNINMLIIAGDIFDKHVLPAEVVVKAKEIFNKFLSKSENKIFYILGQHDISLRFNQEYAWLQLIGNNQQIFTSSFYESEYFVIGGLSYITKFEEFEKFLSSFVSNWLKKCPNKTGIVVIHTTWWDLINKAISHLGEFSFNKLRLFLRKLDLPNKLIIISGDVHIHTMVNITDHVIFLSPGSSHLRTLKEDPIKKFFIISFESPTSFTISEQPIKSREIHNLLTLEEDKLIEKLYELSAENDTLEKIVIIPSSLKLAKIDELRQQFSNLIIIEKHLTEISNLYIREPLAKYTSSQYLQEAYNYLVDYIKNSVGPNKLAVVEKYLEKLILTKDELNDIAIIELTNSLLKDLLHLDFPDYGEAIIQKAMEIMKS
ncbi:MAG: metallophosphoesterase [Nitrososphaeria archaeon]